MNLTARLGAALAAGRSRTPGPARRSYPDLRPASDGMIRRFAYGGIAVVLAVLLVAALAVAAVAVRDTADGPLAAGIHDVLFRVPGVTRLVEWEGRRDARRAFSDGRMLLLGYLHGSNVGELPGCAVDDYDENAGRPEDLPPWSGGAGAHGMMSVSCGDSGRRVMYRFTVLECGNAWDTYQVVYGRSYNREMLRLARRAAAGGDTSNPPLTVPTAHPRRAGAG